MSDNEDIFETQEPEEVSLPEPVPEPPVEPVLETPVEVETKPKKKQRKKRTYTPEQRQAMLERLKKGRETSLAKRKALKEAGVKREYATEKNIAKKNNEKKTVVNNYYSNEKPALDFNTFSTFMDKYNDTRKPKPVDKPQDKPTEVSAPIPIPKNIKYCGINF